MWGMSPIDQMVCRIQFRRADYRGEFTPPRADKHTIEYPGYNGGSDWGSLSIDPVRGVAIANYNDTPNYLKLVPRAQCQQERHQASLRDRHRLDPGARGRPAMGRALRDPGQRRLANGVHQAAVQAPALRRHPRHRHRDRQDDMGSPARHGAAQRPVQHPDRPAVQIGTPNNGGAVTTASGLMFIAAATDDLMRAIDQRTGKECGRRRFRPAGRRLRSIYQQDGREYLVIFAGGHHFMETPEGDSVIAYALPRRG